MEGQEMMVQGEMLESDGTLSTASYETAIMNPKAMNHLVKIAKTLSNSSILPAQYRGNVANCFVACEMAARMDVSPLFVMQNLHVIDGRPSWSSAACIALINGCGLFRDVRFNMVGEAGTPSRGCYVSATRVGTGEHVQGTTVTIQLAIDEGWMERKGSKWKTMPEQMLKYRAAAFFARIECPNALMGFMLDDESRDMGAAENEKVKVQING